MSMNNNWKRNVLLAIAIMSIIMSMLSPALSAFASLEDAEKEFNEKAGEFLEDADEAKDILGILDKDAKENPNPDRNSISFVMKRLLYPGVYVNNVKDGILSSSIEGKKEDFLVDKKYACNPHAPDNLINHNCNIPNFTTSLLQNMLEPFSQPFSNAEKTSSYSNFGLGVPNNIPGGKVPIKSGERNHAYTALELFGYDLKLTSYNGEWDQIVVSNPARMLSNFGVIDKITLAGTTLWNSTREGMSELIENFSFNPTRWFSTAANAFEAGASSGINTVIDTSDLNIVATNEWKRPNLDKTLYNVYVMSDTEILQETMLSYFTIFRDELDKKANEDTELAAVVGRNPEKALSGSVDFKYDAKMETEESKKKRDDARAKRKKEKAKNESERVLEKYYKDNPDLGVDYKADITSPLTSIPAAEYYTEQEQLGFWEDDPAVKSVLDDAREHDLILESSADSYKTYDELKEEWGEQYTPYFEREFDANEDTVRELLEENDSDVFQNHPYLDPKQGLSRYACAKPDGSVMRTSSGSVEYLYKNNNKGEEQSLNSKCSAPRPPIGGGYFGSGWADGKINDTRHISNVESDGAIMSKFTNASISFTRTLNSLAAKITNVILGLSFSPILESLGIDVIVSKLVESFRDTVFFPLAGLAVAIGAVMLFFQLLKNGSAWQLLTSVVFTLFIFIAGATFLLHPTATLKLVDEVPTKMDNIIATALLSDGDDTSYCSTGNDKDGVRAAQCSVWGAMVFEPWVHLQFGTGYDNLYSKGNAPAGSKAMNNENESLVGDAAVNMGDGKIVNNWAMYQLSKTKSGTINNRSSKDKMGSVDKDMYRIVDLQAGPDKGKLSDKSNFEAWAGEGRSGTVTILTLIQAILMTFAIGGLGIVKIEVSFMFALSMLFLPFMLLYALMPKGRMKLQGYLANLVSLMLKRIIVVLMLSVLLKVVIAIYSKSDSLEVAAISSIFVSLAFLLYRKELLELITMTEGGEGLAGGNMGQVKESLGGMVPKYVKQKVQVAKAGVKGSVAGAAGGMLGAAGYQARVRARKAGLVTSLLASKAVGADEDSDHVQALQNNLDEVNDNLYDMKHISQKEIDTLKDKQRDDMIKMNDNQEAINELTRLDKLAEENENEEMIQRLEEENRKLNESVQEKEKIIQSGVRSGASIRAATKKGFIHSREIIGRKAERQIRRDGFATLTAYTDIRDSIYSEGARKITELDEKTAHDVYKEVLSKTELGNSKSTNKRVQEDKRANLMNTPEIQRRVREIAKEREEIAKSGNYIGTTYNNRDIQDDDIEKAAEIIDKKRTRLLTMTKFSKPMEYIEEKKSMELDEHRRKEVSSNVDDVRELIDEEELAERGKKSKVREEQEKVARQNNEYREILDRKNRLEMEKKEIDEMNHEEDDV